jgi:hypothetical protein
VRFEPTIFCWQRRWPLHTSRPQCMCLKNFNFNSFLKNRPICFSLRRIFRFCFFPILCFHVLTDQGCQMVYFQTKIQIWVNFGRSCNGRCWKFFRASLSNLRQASIFYCHFVHFVVIWYIFPVLVCRAEKNLATLF